MTEIKSNLKEDIVEKIRDINEKKTQKFVTHNIDL